MPRAPEPNPGSFRDPLSRVYIDHDAVRRGLRADAAADWEALASSSVWGDLLADGHVVGTRRVHEPVLGSDWPLVLEHDRIDPITYPYEWSHSMLQDAALLQLQIAQRLLDAGFLTKDGSGFNVQFVGSRPVFIDVGSFERLHPGEPWAGYEQFGRHFLAPLALQAVAGIPFQPWLRGSMNGIPMEHAVAAIHGRRRLDRRLGVHLRLQARAQRRFADSERDVRGEMRAAGFGPKVLAAQLRSLERTVRSLAWSASASTWSDYGDRAHYAADDLVVKERFVTAAVQRHRPSMVLDLGANDGRFSRVAIAAGAMRAVAVDGDPLVVDRLYRELRSASDHSILPLVLDLTDPSAAHGWRGRERASFTDRIRPDLVLCLAVVHHLAISETVPFGLIAAQLADFGCPVLVEVPHRQDPMVQKLLARKRAGLFDHYDVANWEAAIGERFSVTERVLLPSGHRTLYLLAT